MAGRIQLVRTDSTVGADDALVPVPEAISKSGDNLFVGSVCHLLRRGNIPATYLTGLGFHSREPLFNWRIDRAVAKLRRPDYSAYVQTVPRIAA